LVQELEEARKLVDFVELPRERGREIEAKAVDVHLRGPVAQRIHDQREHLRAAHVQRVAGARGVEVVASVSRDELVVGRVVDTLEAQRGAEVIALRGVVVDDVEEDLDAGPVQRLHELLELANLAADLGTGPVAHVGREEPDAVVAPVVPEPPVEQDLIVDERMHRHELDRRDAELAQVADHRRVCHAEVRSPQVLGDLGVP
jgi:hypothetical protein